MKHLGKILVGTIILMAVGWTTYQLGLIGNFQDSSSEPEGPPPEHVRIAEAEDSITFVADTGHRIRYLGVRTPLVEENQCFGEEALQAQEAAVGQEVRLEEDPIFVRSQDGAWMRYAFLQVEAEENDQAPMTNDQSNPNDESPNETISGEAPPQEDVIDGEQEEQLEQSEQDEGPEEIFINERILEGGFGFLLASKEMKYAERLQSAVRYAGATGKGLWRACEPYEDEEGRWQTQVITSESSKSS